MTIVSLLACGHFASAAAVVAAAPAGECSRVLTVEVCRECADLVDQAGCLEGWAGSPQAFCHDAGFQGTWTTYTCNVRPLNERCVAPLPQGWLVLTGAGLVEITRDGVARNLPCPSLPPEAPHEWAGRVRGPRLHTSRDGRFAALVSDYGQHALVLDLVEQRVVLTLDRRDHHAETTRFPLTFITTPRGTVVVAPTRRDGMALFDAATGRLLSDRRPDPEWQEWPDGREPRESRPNGRISWPGARPGASPSVARR
jgi:hypothetical protein